MAWLGTLPPLAVYACLALLAFLEAIIPVVPSDVATALGAFLSHSGKTSALTVFGTVTVANVLGAMLVYLLSRRMGRRFFGTPTGQRLLSPGAIAVIERDYLRLGMVGLFLARFIPGVRAVVPPCAGIFGIPWVRTLVVILGAALVWNGAIVGAATLLGSEWERVRAFLYNLGQVTGVAATVAMLLIGALFWLRRRRARQEPEPVLAAVETALGPVHDADAPIDAGHAARLIIELAYADEALSDAQRVQVEADLRARWGLLPRPPVASPPPVAGRLGRLALRLAGRFSTGRRVQLVERMWQAAFAEGTLAPAQEAWLLRRATELLGLKPEEIAAVRRRSASAD